MGCSRLPGLEDNVTMRQVDALSVLRDRAEILRERYEVAELSVFGSVARDAFTEDSDVDLLVQFRGGATIQRLLDLKDFLEGLLHRKVDLVTTGALHPLIREDVLREAIRVA